MLSTSTGHLRLHSNDGQLVHRQHLHAMYIRYLDIASTTPVLMQGQQGGGLSGAWYLTSTGHFQVHSSRWAASRQRLHAINCKNLHFIRGASAHAGRARRRLTWCSAPQQGTCSCTAAMGS